MKKSLTLAAIVGSALLYGQNVGINTENPTAKLHINGDMTIRNTSGTIQNGSLLRWDPTSHKVVGDAASSKVVKTGWRVSPNGEYFPETRKTFDGGQTYYGPYITDISSSDYNLIVSSSRLQAATEGDKGYIGITLFDYVQNDANHYTYKCFPVSHIKSFEKDGKWAFALDYVKGDYKTQTGSPVHWKLGITLIDKSYSDQRVILVSNGIGIPDKDGIPTKAIRASLPSNPLQ